MSLSQNSRFFKEYAKSGYLSKINPEFQGIAKKYYNQKHEHQKLHHMKKKLDQEVAYVERLEKKMHQHLQKKKDELRYAKQVSNRFHIDIQRRQSLDQYKTQLLKNNQEKAQLIKAQSQRKIKEAKKYISQSKRSLADQNRSENKKIKQMRNVKKAQQWDTSRSRVSQIYQFKKNVKENTNNFYKEKTNSSLNNYQKRIKSYKKFSEIDNEKIKVLENLKKNINQNFTKNKQKADEINQQIIRIKEETKLENNLLKSRLKSRSSSSLSNSSVNKMQHARQKSQLLLLNHH